MLAVASLVTGRPELHAIARADFKMAEVTRCPVSYEPARWTLRPGRPYLTGSPTVGG